MHTITFPLFSLTFTISEVAFRIFGVDIYWYAIFIVGSIVLGILLCKREDGKYGIAFSTIFDLLLYLLPISIIGARCYYVLFHLDYFLAEPMQILNLRNGGLAIYGGIIAGAITTMVFCKKRNIALLDVLDYIAPYVILGQAIGRLGNFFNGEAFGIPTTLPWRMGIEHNGIYQEVHPTFLYEMLANISIFGVMQIIKNKRQYSGQITLFYFLLYSFARIWIEGLRADSLMLGPIRISQLLSIAIFVTSCLIIIYKRRANKKMQENRNK